MTILKKSLEFKLEFKSKLQSQSLLIFCIFPEYSVNRNDLFEQFFGGIAVSSACDWPSKIDAHPYRWSKILI